MSSKTLWVAWIGSRIAYVIRPYDLLAARRRWRWERRQRCLSVPRPTCTGITARWCPVCGDCACPPGERDSALRHDDPGCPLHAPTSRHGGSDG